MRPLLSVVLVPSMPMNDDRLSTAGSCRITAASACCRSAIAGNEIDLRRLGDAQDHAGVLHREEALRHDDVEHDGERRGSPTATSSVAVWWREHPAQRRAVGRDDPVEARAPTRGRSGPARSAGVWRSSRAHIIGVSVSETTAEIRIVTPSVTANSRNSRPTMSPMNSSGISTAISETVSERMVKPICSAPLSAASQRRVALLDVARDVLDHHDGVVDHEAGGDGERHQRQVVQAEAEQVHDAEGADQRQRHRDAGNDRGRQRCAGTGRSPARPAPTGQHQLELHVLDRGADGRRCGRSAP